MDQQQDATITFVGGEIAPVPGGEGVALHYVGSRMMLYIDPPFVCVGNVHPYQHFQRQSDTRTYRFLGPCEEIIPLRHAHPGVGHGHL
jgi:hypothetical protein